MSSHDLSLRLHGRDTGVAEPARHHAPLVWVPSVCPTDRGSS
jgi:hypothetical protein